MRHKTGNINDWQLAFLSNGRQFVEQFNIKYPSHVFISPSYDRDAFVNLYIRIKNHDDTSEESAIDVSIFKEEARKWHRIEYITHKIPGLGVGDRIKVNSFRQCYAPAPACSL